MGPGSAHGYHPRTGGYLLTKSSAGFDWRCSLGEFWRSGIAGAAGHHD
ncbi:MAG: hypothetical protein R3F11_19920 [Verrucomicrobiales bacterium]